VALSKQLSIAGCTALENRRRAGPEGVRANTGAWQRPLLDEPRQPFLDLQAGAIHIITHHSAPWSASPPRRGRPLLSKTAEAMIEVGELGRFRLIMLLVHV